MRKLLFILFFSWLQSCNQEKIGTQVDKDGVVTKIPFLWKSRISDGARLSAISRGYLVDEKGLLCVAMKNSTPPEGYGDNFLQLKDIQTGRNIWEWDDLFDKRIANTIRQGIDVQQGRMLLHDGRSRYFVDTDAGKTIWKGKSELPGIGPHASFLDDRYFIKASDPEIMALDIAKDAIYEGNYQNGDLRQIAMPKYSDEYFKKVDGRVDMAGAIVNFHAFKKEGKSYLIIPYAEPGPVVKYSSVRALFGMYNLDTRKWMYDRIPMGISEDGTTASVVPVIDGDFVYMTSRATVDCYEVMTGKRVWQTRLTETNTTALDLIVDGSNLLINSGDATLYCLDKTTGTKRWSLPSSAFASDLYCQDGTVYWIATNALRAADIQSGKMLWNMESPDKYEEGRSDSWFWGFVTGLPSHSGNKGKIFVSTNLNIYAFDAVK